MSMYQVGIHLFLQMTVIVATCRLLGWIGQRYLHQTQVFMEMATGVILGPSVVGLVAPQVQSWLFPRQLVVGSGSETQVTHPNMTILYAVAQIGLVLYMFVIGLEFDLARLKGRAKSAGVVSSTGIVVPFVLAALVVPYLVGRGDLFSSGVSFGVAWLFLGAATAITAFPMLARILYERGLASTSLGTLTLAAASIDDAAAWCMLALVVALFHDSPATVLTATGGGIAYAVFMLTVGRIAFQRIFREANRTGEISHTDIASVMVALMLCAYVTDLIGIYAVFGAFVCGAAMPKGAFASTLAQRIEQLTTSLLLPTFFVYSGLNTQVGLLNSVELWLVAGLVTLIAALGKGLACGLAAKFAGESWHHSTVIGVLMNARGLMELILMNIGLEVGVISPTFFTIMVLMAIVTTGMTSPLLLALIPGLNPSDKAPEAPVEVTVRA